MKRKDWREGKTRNKEYNPSLQHSFEVGNVFCHIPTNCMYMVTNVANGSTPYMLRPLVNQINVNINKEYVCSTNDLLNKTLFGGKHFLTEPDRSKLLKHVVEPTEHQKTLHPHEPGTVYDSPEGYEYCLMQITDNFSIGVRVSDIKHKYLLHSNTMPSSMPGVEPPEDWPGENANLDNDEINKWTLKRYEPFNRIGEPVNGSENLIEAQRQGLEATGYVLDPRLADLSGANE